MKMNKMFVYRPTKNFDLHTAMKIFIYALGINSVFDIGARFKVLFS